jgi:two-component system, sensor histidine kinase and response regulator
MEATDHEVHILLVEDNPGDVLLLREYVKDFAFYKVEIDDVDTLGKALSNKGNEYQAILLDLSLPDSTGLDSLRKVKQAYPNTPLIVLTGLNNTETAKIAVSLGADDYLIKGKVDPFLLEKTITYSIERNKYYHQKLEIDAAHRENDKLMEINNRLNILIRQVERSKARLEEFAYVATHNLRAPVVNLKSLIQLLSRAKESFNKQNQDILNKIEITVNNLTTTLQDLINIVAITRRNNEAKEVVSFKEIITSVCQNLEAQLNEASPELITDFSDAPNIIYPKGHIESICQNLITNAIKYRSERPLRINIRTEDKGKYILLEISDNGSGIDLSKNKDKIFKMFQRLHSSGEGKGLGLYIIKSQVERLGGKVEVESEPGKGASFKIYLRNDPDLVEETEQEYHHEAG